MRTVVNFILLLACFQHSTATHRTLQDARNERSKLMNKYIKTLKKEEGAIKLVGGRHDYEGNVEVLHNGKWGAICDDEWDKAEGEVICRQLGFPGFKKVTHSAAFGLAKRKFWMDNLFCTGKEAEITDCHFDGWGQSDCESTEAAGVICKSPTPHHEPKPIRVKVPKRKIHHKQKMELRLVGGRIHTEGRVEVRFGGSGRWGTICADGWSLLEANVACRELGFGYANDAIQTDYFGGANKSKIILSGTECYGNETTLFECVHHDPDKHVHCHGPKNHVAAVTCTKNLPDLMFDHIELEQSTHLEDKAMFYLQCAMEENCVANEAYEIQKENDAWHLETRRLLKFTVRVMNVGNTDFRPSIPKHLWEWHMCHMHYHSMEVFATYDIFDANNVKVAQGHKASFCLEDNQCLPGIEPRYACANYGDQGISVNCSDIYRYNIDCQWVDITEMDFGDYTLKIAVNPEFKVAEMSFDNNAAICKLTYTQQYARVFDCKMGRP
ncbi:lysyl oxidase homolog 3B [Hermetia illucens]|uniref:lysyl oxidase homolog 3B n=1 Tax=Hermetia illucens TaxID=343691 RepID=UPI0018CC45D1|nr:lysyl oxidase homolog 3B [Hermetia illucens]